MRLLAAKQRAREALQPNSGAHILILPSWYSTPEQPWGGGFLLDQARALSQAGARVGLVHMQVRSLRRLTFARLAETHFQLEVSTNQGVTVLRRNGWNTLAQTTLGARVWVELTESLVRRYVERFGRPDIIHAHSALWAGRAGLLSAERLGVPCVITEHSSLIGRRLLTRAQSDRIASIYRAAHAVLAVSRALLSSIHAIAGSEIGEVVPNAVDVAYFTTPPVPRRREPFTFLSVSNLVPGKRLDLLIRSFARAFDGSTDVRLVVVGAGDQDGVLQHLVSTLAIWDSVQFTGALSRHEVREHMWKANALVLPSVYETFGVVLIEALATGIPVIATRSGGPEDIVTDEIGMLLNSDSEQSIANGLREMVTLEYPEGRLRQYVAKRFSFNALAERLANVYTRVSDGRLGNPRGLASPLPVVAPSIGEQ